MRLTFFTFFNFFLFNQLVKRIQNDFLKKDLNILNHSALNSYSNQEHVQVHKKSYLRKTDNISVLNPSNFLLNEKKKILKRESISQSHKPSYFWPSIDKFLGAKKAKNASNYNSNHINFRPTVFNLDETIPNSSQNSNTHDLSIDNLKNLVKIDFENKYEKKRSRIFMPSYQGFHGEIYPNFQNFQHKNIKIYKREIKSADINDYNRWLYDGSKTSRLERFKKLYDEFSNLNNHAHDHDFDVKKKPNIQMEKPLKMLKKTIEQIELQEKRKDLKQEL